MNYKKRMVAILLLICTLVTMLPVTAIASFAEELGAQEKEDAMEDIRADEALNSMLQGDTQRYDDDGYIGIPYEISVYYDISKGAAKPGHMTTGGTPVMMYVVNGSFERIGTDSDISIITSMLKRGYVVIVLDYLGSEKAIAGEIEWSSQIIKNKAIAGEFFTDKTVFPNGTYNDTLTVPAGYNVRLNDVFFELDKHGTDGTLEKIVNVWNNDFRKYKGEMLVKWTNQNGARKQTQNAFDGSAPMWYDASGKTDANGSYTNIKYTKAVEITDCVKPDGSPIDLNLYMHIVYPTNPENEVPVAALFSSAEYMTDATTKADRPHVNAFLFGGYAGVVFDYAYMPMGRNDHYGYFDGSSGNSLSVTGYNQIYATYTFNAAQNATAAMRYIRYLSLTDHDTFKFSGKIGVLGISKSAYMTQLGAPELRNGLITSDSGMSDTEVAQSVNDKINSFYQQYWLPEHHGESRYDNGDTEAYTKYGATIDGGELQPWAVYEGNEIASGADVIYSSCGASTDYIREGYAPLFTTLNLSDTYNTEYYNQNIMANLCRTHNVPSLWLEADIAHTFAQGPDYNYGVDTYKAMIDFFDYYLKDDGVSVLYTDPMNGYAGMKTTEDITVKFVGEVSENEIKKISLKDSDGNKVSGEWTSAYGGTEWTFTHSALEGSEVYTLTVPDTLVGVNGKPIEQAYEAVFYTVTEVSSDFALTDTVTMTDYNNTYVSFDMPTLTGELNQLKLRLNVSKGVNTVRVYAASAKGDNTGALIDEIKVSGEGYYEIDVTDHVMSLTDAENVCFRIRTAYTSGSGSVYEEDFNSGVGDFKTNKYTEYENAEIDGDNAVKMTLGLNNGDFGGNHHFYEGRIVLENAKCINGGKAFTKDDLGRTFLITVKIYDTVSRPIRIYTKSMTSQSAAELDYDRTYYNFITKANEWIEIQVPYTVYETEYGVRGNISQAVYIWANPTGNTEMPIYVGDFRVEEVYTDVKLSEAALVSAVEGDKAYKAPAAEQAFEVNGAAYASFKEAIEALSNGGTVKLMRNYEFTEADAVSMLADITIDLNGYKITAKGDKSLINLTASDASEAVIKLKNGTVILSDAPLVSYGEAAVDGKSYSVNIENVYIGLAEGAYLENVISARSINGDYSVNVSIDLANCVIDVNRRTMAKNPVKVLPMGVGALKLEYTLAGGRIIIDSSVDVTLTETAVVVRMYIDGKYPEMIAPASVKTLPVMTMIKDGEYAQFTYDRTGDGYTVYTAQLAPIRTEYGIIPEKYEDAEKYPFAIFMNHNFISVKGSFADALSEAIRLFESDAGITVDVLMRRDFVSNDPHKRIYRLNGTMNLDLGGYSLTANSNLLEFSTLEYTGNGTTYLNISNGSLLVGARGLAVFESKTSLAKRYEVTFNEVAFGVAEGYSRGQMFYHWDASGSGTVTNVITFNDCVFDFTGVTGEVKLTAIDVASSNLDTTVTINGGKIIANDLSNVTFYKESVYSKLYFGNGSDGEAMKLVLPISAVAPKLSFITADNKVLVFADGVTEGESIKYGLTLDTSSVTPYGAVPTSYSDAATYPFVMFKDGGFVFAAKNWTETVDKAIELIGGAGAADKSVTVLLRADVTATSSASMSAIGGTFILDLDGHTITRADHSVFEATAMHNYATKIVVKNGTLETNGKRVITAQPLKNDGFTSDKSYSFTFDNVKFVAGKDTKTDWGFVILTYGGTVSYTGHYDMVFSDCTFDSSAATQDLVVFKVDAATTEAKITVNGGKFIGGSGKLTLISGSNDQLIFGKGSDSAYPTVTVPSGATLTESGYMTVEGAAVKFGNAVTAEGNTTYSLVEDSTNNTVYGGIPTSYGDASQYPFVIFKDGKFVGAAADWSAATHLAYNTPNGGKAVLLMRTDHDFTSSNSPARLYMINGELTIDLGGHTLTGSNHTLFEGALDDNYTGDVVGKPTSLIVKNGTILSNNKSVFVLQSSAPGGKTYDVDFENVTFGWVEGTTRNRIFHCWDVRKSDTVATLDFTDCTLDFTNVTFELSMFMMDSPTVDAAITFRGGAIKANSLDSIKLCQFDSSGEDSFRFAPNGNGDYTTLTMPTTAAPHTTQYTLENGKIGVFENATVSGTNTVYTMGESKLVTDYGVIPESEKDAVFVMFDSEKKFVASKATWADASAYAASYFETNKGATLYMLMRDDHVCQAAPTKIASMNGTLVLDLGGKSLTRKWTLFEMGMDSGKESWGGYETHLVVKNGSILAGTGQIMSFGHGTAASKVMTVKFENVTFGIASGSTPSSLFCRTWGQTGSGKTNTVITLDGCTIDLRDKPSNTSIIIENNQGNVILRFIMNGGEILMSSNVSLTTGDSKLNTVVFGKLNGTYPTLTLPSGQNVSATEYVTTDCKAVKFGNGVTDNGGIVYSLVEVPGNSTKYGAIPSAYIDASKYVFVLFDDSKIFVNAAESWADALAKAKSYLDAHNGETVYVLVRNDITYTAPNSGTPNITTMNGTLVVDLGGHYIARNSTIFEATYVAGSEAYATKLIVKNGMLLAAKGQFVSFGHSSKTVTKDFTLTFEEVTFGFTSGSTAGALFCRTWDHGGSTTTSIVLNDCTIDLTNRPSSCGYFFEFNLKGIKYNFKMNGGKIIGSMSGVNLFLTDADDSVAYGKGKSGFTEYVLTAGNPPGSVMTVENGAQDYVKVSEEGGVSTYQLGIMTDYGMITPEYTDIEKNLFVFFVDGKCIGGTDSWGAASQKVNEILAGTPGKTVYVLMRDDHYSTVGAKQLCTVNGTLVLDLGGNSLIATTNLFEFATGEYTGDYDTYFTVKNGTLLVGKRGIGVFQSASNYSKHYVLRFENVTFGVDEDYERAKVFYHWDTNSKGVITVDLKLENCVFDFKDVVPENKLNVFDIAASNIKSDISINGGKILAKTLSDVILYVEHVNNSIIFAKNGEGKYTTLTLPTAEKAHTTLYNTDMGIVGAFTDGQISGNDTVYTFAPCTHKYTSDCDKICNVCNFEREGFDHVPADDWSYADGKHWLECINDGCDTKLSYADCEGENECSEQCATCGNERTERAAHTYDKENPDCDTECNVCGAEREAQHNYNVLKHNELKHWNECNCGAVDVSSRENHHGGSATCVEGKKCADCDFEYTEAIGSHLPVSEWSSDGEYHWKECEYGCTEMLNRAKCYGGNATCMDKAVCSVCGNGHGDLEEHSYDSKCDVKCNNGCGTVRSDTTPHVYEKVCSTECKYCGEKREASHVYDNGCDTTCNECYETRTPEAHTGGNATCTSRAKCSVCGKEYGELADHSFGSEWKSNSQRHWHECACGQKSDEAEHQYGAWKIEDGKRIRTCVCGSSENDPNYVETDNGAGYTLPIAVGTVAAVVAIGAAVWFTVFRKKKK